MTVEEMVKKAGGRYEGIRPGRGLCSVDRPNHKKYINVAPGGGDVADGPYQDDVLPKVVEGGV